LAQNDPPPATAPSLQDRPDLIVAISVDQFSADMFSQYRRYFTGGLARLQQGMIFPNGYQAHAATETCPGHSTILTGQHPANTGIIANGWVDFSIARQAKEVYCAEDVNQAGPNGRYVPSAVNLLVPTLGEMMKDAFPASRNVAVSGKDRGALMMGGTNVDAIAYWTGAGFGPATNGAGGQSIARANDRVTRALTDPASLAAYDIPAWCTARTRPVVQITRDIGDNPLAMEPGDTDAFRQSPRLDGATIDLARDLVTEMDLGNAATPDLLAISLSATDYVGHAFGTNGVESCIQVAQMDRMLGDLFTFLDGRGHDYLVVLTADHGGLDLPERASLQAADHAHRVDPELGVDAMDARIARETGITGRVLVGEYASGDVYLAPTLSPADGARVLQAALAAYRAHPDVAGAYSSDEIMAVPMPAGDPREWSVLQRLRASHNTTRSGDIVLILQPEVTPIYEPSKNYVATHGSPWDYDRRVPILFWQEGMAQAEQPNAVMTVDIAPTLAARIGLPVADDAFDGHCIDIDAGVMDSCSK
jgi:arylsulfatase A-like enzyme